MIAILVALIMNWLMLYHDLGLGMFLSVMLTIGYLGERAYKKGLIDREWLLKASIIIVASLVFILRDMMVFKVITLLLLPFAYALLYVAKRPVDILGQVCLSVLEPLKSFGDLGRHLVERLFRKNPNLKFALAGIVLGGLLLFLILPLLLSSDQVMNSIFEDFILDFHLSLGEVFRWFFVYVIASYLYAQGRMTYVKKRKKIMGKGPDNQQGEVYVRKPLMSRAGKTTMLTTILAMVDLVYLFYVFIQVKYLFLHLGELPEGINYATYARSGFFQLLVVILINLGLVLLFEKLNKEKIKLQRSMEVLTFILTLIMSFASFYKMYLYEEHHGYTELRLLVFLFLIMIMVFIGIYSIYLVTDERKCLYGLAVFCMAYYLVVSLVNIPAFIAYENIHRYEEGFDVDIEYLIELPAGASGIVKDFIMANEKDIDEDTWYVNHSLLEDKAWQSWNIQRKNQRILKNYLESIR